MYRLVRKVGSGGQLSEAVPVGDGYLGATLGSIKVAAVNPLIEEARANGPPNGL